MNTLAPRQLNPRRRLAQVVMSEWQSGGLRTLQDLVELGLKFQSEICAENQSRARQAGLKEILRDALHAQRVLNYGFHVLNSPEKNQRIQR